MYVHTHMYMYMHMQKTMDVLKEHHPAICSQDLLEYEAKDGTWLALPARAQLPHSLCMSWIKQKLTKCPRIVMHSHCGEDNNWGIGKTGAYKRHKAAPRSVQQLRTGMS